MFKDMKGEKWITIERSKSTLEWLNEKGLYHSSYLSNW